MPLTNAERQRKWWEKKAKEVGQNEMRKEDNERRKMQRKKARMEENADRIFKKKQAERKKSQAIFFNLFISFITNFFIIYLVFIALDYK